MQHEREVQPHSPDNLLALAQQDAFAAYELYNGIKNPYYKDALAIDVANCFANVGLDTAEFIPAIDRNIRSNLDNGGGIMHLLEKGQLQVRIGDIKGAFASAEDMKSDRYRDYLRNEPVYLYHDIAQSTQDANITQEALKKGEEAIATSEDINIRILLRLARVAYLKGLPPDSFLNQARNINDPETRDFLAETYAMMGHFDEALSLIPKIPDKPSRLEALRNVAYQQITAGKFDEAIQTAELTGDPFSKISITIRSLKDRLKTKKGVSNSEIDNAIKSVQVYERTTSLDDFNQHNEYNAEAGHVANFYSEIAEIQASLGNNPTLLFQKALEMAMEIPHQNDKYYIIGTLINIASAEAKKGLDINPILDRVFTLTDTILEKGEKMDQMEYFELESAYKELAEAGFDAGHDDVLDKIFEKFDKLEKLDADKLIAERIFILALRAKARMSRAKQVNASTPQE